MPFITTNPDLFVQPYDPEQGPVGKPRQIFAARLSTQGTPTFSPNGKRIAFVSMFNDCKAATFGCVVLLVPPLRTFAKLCWALLTNAGSIFGFLVGVFCTIGFGFGGVGFGGAGFGVGFGGTGTGSSSTSQGSNDTTSVG